MRGLLGPPTNWRITRRLVDGVQYRVPGGLTVIASVGVHDGQRWAHLSASHPGRLPSWPELVAIRDALLGDDVEAYQVAPPRERYVNINPGVLHLWACLDRPAGVLPRFEGTLPDGRLTI